MLEPPVPPVYVPTPKHILEARKENGPKTTVTTAAIVSLEPTKKRPRLEYVPRSKHPVDNALPAPTYVPSAISSPSDEYVPANESNETDDLTGIASELISTNETTQNLNEVSNESKCAVLPEISTGSNETSMRTESEEKSSSRRGSNSKSSSHSSHHSDRHKHGSSSSKSSHRSTSSSHKKSTSSHSSSSSSRSKSKYSDKDKEKDKEKGKDKDRSSSKDGKKKDEERNGEKKSSSSQHRSSSHKRSRHRSSSSERKTKGESASSKEKCNLNALMYETDLEEDDVEAQCRMIFEEFDPETVPPSDADSTAPTGTDETHDPMAKYDDSAKRKRVAYENAESQHKPSKSSKPSTNHVQNAMKVRSLCHSSIVSPVLIRFITSFDSRYSIDKKSCANKWN